MNKNYIKFKIIFNFFILLNLSYFQKNGIVGKRRNKKKLKMYLLNNKNLKYIIFF